MILIAKFRSQSFNLALSLLFLLISGGFVSAQTPTIDSEEKLMLKLINEYRAQNGLSQLKTSIVLTRSADWMTTDMATQNRFNHIDSLGRDPSTRMGAFGYNYTSYRGENLAAGFNDAARTFEQWKKSPTHNEVMLYPEYKVIGISRLNIATSQYKWYWTTDFGSYVDATFEDGPAPGQNVKTVNAANYSETIAPDALVAAFGTQLSQSTAIANSLPLPTSMAGVSLTINDTPTQLLYVSPTQINYVVPANVNPGVATVRVTINGSQIAAGTVNVEQVSPSIFTVSTDGKGVPSAQTTLDGVSFQPVANPDGSPRSLSVGTSTRPNYLVLYGTAMRRRSSLGNVQVTIGGFPTQVSFLGAHSQFAGLDQLNISIPMELRGRGLVDVVVTIDGRAANTVVINIGG
ncbi:MAG: CAP domain-containing protein [Acidobacteria bacterium]|nr:CAP domain-containing protein [Acidobacteriota bacterium]